MKHVKHLLSLLLVAAMLAAATACGGGSGDTSAAGAGAGTAGAEVKDDGPKGFVETYMNLLSKGDVSGFAKLSGEDEAELQVEYDNVMGSVSDTLGEYEISDETAEKVLSACQKVLASAKYTVNEPVETDTGYEVTVDIEPITGLFETLLENVEEELQTAYQSGEVTEENMNDWLFGKLADKMIEKADSLTYGEVQSVTIQLTKSGNSFAIQDEETVGGEIGAALIDTSGITG